MGQKIECLNPLFHHSSIPIFQWFSDSSIPICLLCGLCSQPIMLRVLPVKVWLRQLTVWPDSHTRRFLGATPGSESSKVKALAGEEQATHRAVA
jgi:hypothetical protein